MTLDDVLERLQALKARYPASGFAHVPDASRLFADGFNYEGGYVWLFQSSADPGYGWNGPSEHADYEDD